MFCRCLVDNNDSLLQHIICVQSQLTIFQEGFAFHIVKYIGIKCHQNIVDYSTTPPFDFQCNTIALCTCK